MQNINPKTTDLRWLVNQIITSSQPVAVKKNSFFINDVPAEMHFMADAGLVAAVMSELFQSMASHAQNSCIRITAQLNSNVVLVKVRDNNQCNTVSVADSLQQMQGITQKIGGFLGITSIKKDETVITFSFPYLALSA